MSADVLQKHRRHMMWSKSDLEKSMNQVEHTRQRVNEEKMILCEMASVRMTK